MSYDVIATPRFSRELKRLAKKYPSLKDEYFSLVETLETHPNTGIPIGRHCYKIRLSIASKGKGKSGSSRIITNVYVENNIVFLLSIYNKGEQDDIHDNEILK